MTMKRIIVFLGPSLALDIAQSLLPEAMFLPPVSCGDILRVIRLQPDIIIIIDGFFENQPAVWHKEILYALSLGVKVFGSSSMGALRASELASFGMQPFGEVALQFHLGECNDDDEVALLHGNHSQNFAASSDPMVNIRATLELALKQNIIDMSLYDKLMTYSKNQYYPERNLRAAITHINTLAFSPALVNLNAWINEHGMVDIKQQDALALLHYIADTTFSSTSDALSCKTYTTLSTTPRDLFAGSMDNKTNTFHFNASNLFRGLQKSIQCRPFTSDYPWLPQTERIALHARYLEDYLLIKQLAYLLSACYQLALDEPSLDAFNINEIYDKLALTNANLNKNYSEKLLILLNFMTIHSQNKKDIEKYLFLLMKANNIYTSYKEQILPDNSSKLLQRFQQITPSQYQLYYLIALCWHIIDARAACLALTPNITVLQNYADNFRKRHQLHTVIALQDWFMANDLDAIGFEHMMLSMFNMHYFAVQHQIDLLVSQLYDDDTWWFHEALQLSGYETKAKQLLDDNEALRIVKASLATQVNNEDFWLARDLEMPETSI